MLGLDLLKAKARAGLLHLIISALAVGVLAWLTLTVWYPDGLATLQGVWKILGLVAVVDVILGPALTVLVYKPRKRTLVFDLSVIALIQIAALTYGAWTISAQRPAYLAYMYDRFFVVTARDILDEPPATVQAIEGNRALLAMPGGSRLSVEAEMPLSVGRKVTVGIRPEALHFVDEGEFAGAINVIERLGSETLCYVDIGADDLVTVEVAHDAEVAINDRRLLGVDNNRLHLFDDKGLALVRR